jgi:predicted RNA binding protein YcfA (HicA-like mRNA interferase family)
MRLPRDISGDQLAKALSRYGYAVTRQTGSHMRLTTQANGEHHVTVPAHYAIRVGTLNAILGDVASHLGMEKEQLIQTLFE